MEMFRRAVEIVFNNWSALEIAVNQSGASDSTKTIITMIDRVVETVLPGDGAEGIIYGGNFDDQYLIDYLTETLDDQFNTICEDNSPEEIVEVIKKLFECVVLGVDPLLLPEIKKLNANKNWIPTPTTPPNSEVEPGFAFTCLTPSASGTVIEADFDASKVVVKETEDLVVSFPFSPRSAPKQESELASKLEKLSLSPTVQEQVLAMKPCDEGLPGPGSSSIRPRGELQRAAGEIPSTVSHATQIGHRMFRINKPPAVERTEDLAVGGHGEEVLDKEEGEKAASDEVKTRDEEEALGEEEGRDEEEGSDDDEKEEALVVRVRSGKPGAKKKKTKYHHFRYSTLKPKTAAGYGFEPYADESAASEEAAKGVESEEAAGGVEPHDSDGDQWEDVKARKHK